MTEQTFSVTLADFEAECRRRNAAGWECFAAKIWDDGAASAVWVSEAAHSPRRVPSLAPARMAAAVALLESACHSGCNAERHRLAYECLVILGLRPVPAEEGEVPLG